MIKTIGLEMRWRPVEYGRLFCDNQDHLGIVYWYDLVVEQIERIEQAAKAAKKKKT